MKKPVVIAVICTAVFAVTAALLVLVPRDITIVTSTSGFITTSYHAYDSNPVLKIKLPSFRFNKDKIKETKEKQEDPYKSALAAVLEKDAGAFHDKFTSESSCVCEVGDYIYYFRTADTGNVYKLNKQTGSITSCPMSGYNSFSNIELKARYKEIDHNFTAFVCIKTEALIDSFPELRAAIESKGNDFYCHYIYYENGRVFFENRNKLYEFIPKTGKAEKVASVGNETIEFIVAG